MSDENKTEINTNSENDSAVENSDKLSLNRRGFIGSVIAGSAVASVGLVGMTNKAEAGLSFPEGRGLFAAGGAAAGAVHRSESDLYDCEVDGDFPADLDGSFFRVGPDAQYPKQEGYENDIAFDGEGHVTTWRIKDGHVDYKSRYVQTQRWKAQHEARESLFGMYRNPTTDDPRAAGFSRGTANTQIFVHHNKLLALKEDSPAVAMDPITLETTDDYYTFGGGMKGETFTAHPKIDSETGELIGFGYEAKGLLSKDIEIFSADPKTGNVNWTAWIQVPYACMLHDFAVTQNHVAFLVNPLAANQQIIDAGGPHFAWDSTLPSWLGVMRRGGDGSDIRWFKGPGEMATHTMGAWSDGDKFYWDVDGADSNQFPFFPQLHEQFDGAKSAGHMRRMSVDMNQRGEAYDIEIMYPTASGGLARQDDRYHTVPYRYGYMIGGGGWWLLDHEKGTQKLFSLPDTSLAEMCFVPKNENAGEGEGYLIGLATRRNENGRSDLILIDAQRPDDGVIATVKMPYRVPGQVHGFWATAKQMGV